MQNHTSTDLHVFDIMRFELFTRVGISAAYLSGGYEGAKACYEGNTGRSFEVDMNLARNYYRTR